MRYDDDKPTWHDAPGDLERLGQIEAGFDVYYLNLNSKASFEQCLDALRLMELHIYGLTNFEEKKHKHALDEMNIISQLITTSDLNQDGHFDEFERQRASQKLGEAKYRLGNLFKDLKQIKKKYGLSVNVAENERILKQLQKLNEFKAWFDDKIMLNKADIEMLYHEKLERGFAYQNRGDVKFN